MLLMKIPLHKPYWDKREESVTTKALRSGLGIGDGPRSKEVALKLKKLLSVKHVFPVTSCTSAMDLAIACLGVKSGDEVIVPSFTMTSTANCIVLRGGRPVFTDIDPKTYCIDPEDIERVITKQTRGIMVVHYAGMPAPMERILALAKKYKLFVVEDAAHAIGASYRGKQLGTFGTAGAFSFHGTKNISCGEGGAFVTNDEVLAQKAEIFRANGTNRNAFLRGEVSLYHWVGEGTSFFVSDILASILAVQLDKIDTINKKRQQIAAYYNNVFFQYPSLVQLLTVPKDAVPNWHIYPIKFTTEKARRKFQSVMREAGIEVSTHYVPLHTSPMGRTFGGHKRRLPVTDEVAATLVRLPIYPSLTPKELQYISATAQSILRTM